MPERTRPSRDRMIIAAAVVAALGGYIAGTSGTSSAYADKKPRYSEPILPAHFAPPAVAVEQGGYAVVGGADSRYYVVRGDGTSCVVQLGRRGRDLLYWR